MNNLLALKVPPVAQVAVSVAMMLFAKPDNLVVSSMQWGLAMLITVLGVYTAIAGVLAFKKAKTTVNPMTPDASSNLVNSGIYQLTRNPMYLGMLLIQIALAVVLMTTTSLLCCLAFVFYMTAFQIKPEEQALSQLFGQEYQLYQRQVGRWFWKV